MYIFAQDSGAYVASEHRFPYCTRPPPHRRASRHIHTHTICASHTRQPHRPPLLSVPRAAPTPLTHTGSASQHIHTHNLLFPHDSPAPPTAQCAESRTVVARIALYHSIGCDPRTREAPAGRLARPQGRVIRRAASHIQSTEVRAGFQNLVHIRLRGRILVSVDLLEEIARDGIERLQGAAKHAKRMSMYRICRAPSTAVVSS